MGSAEGRVHDLAMTVVVVACRTMNMYWPDIHNMGHHTKRHEDTWPTHELSQLILRSPLRVVVPGLMVDML